MRRNPNYLVKAVGEAYYLVPFGQAIEMYSPTLWVDEVTAFLWGEMHDQWDVKTLTKSIANAYDVGAEEAISVEEDVRNLVRNLRKAGVILDDNPNCEESVSEVAKESFGMQDDVNDKADEQTSQVIKIAGITIQFCGKPELFPEYFTQFCMRNDENADAEIRVSVKEKRPPEMGKLPQTLKGSTVSVVDGRDFYVIRATGMPALKEAHIRKDGSRAIIYIDAKATASKPALMRNAISEDKELLSVNCVFHVIRHVFLLKAQTMDMYVIHSASILYNGHAWLFSALSGTGKSTHTNLWNKLYGTPFLNGDLNLLAFEEGKPVVKGIPWCGTSGIFTTETYPLGGIILLARDKTNHVEELSYQNQVLGIQMRFISPKWNEKQTTESIDFAERIARSARIARLFCNMEDEAAEVCRAWIDNRKS